MAALVDTADQSYITEQSYVISSSDLSSLNTLERKILEDSYARPTSDELLEKVRKDAIDLFANS